MNVNEGKNSNLLVRTWKKSWRTAFPNKGGLAKSKSWNGKETVNKKMAPEGYIPVYVGQEKQKFAVKTKYVNHPLFSMLLEDTETEHGYNYEGPIMLPCDVDLFYSVLAEMEVQSLGWSFAYGSCSPFSPSRSRLGSNSANQMGKGYGSYQPLTTSSSIKMMN